MAEYHNIASFVYKAVSITRVQSVQFEPMTGAIVDRIDGSGAYVTLGVANASFSGSVTFLDQTEANKFANKHEADGTFQFVVKNAVDATDTVDATVVVTGPTRGFSHSLPGSGPYVVEFTAATCGI